jgi:hypothetical protein
MWIVMAKGQTYYVEHVEANLAWTTKETPDNIRTKGAIKFKECLVTIDDDNCARISVLTKADATRINNLARGIIRIITSWPAKLKQSLAQCDIKHGPIQHHSAGCGTSWYITDIYNAEDHVMLQLMMAGTNYRALQPNEAYYKWYDDKDSVDLDAYNDDYEDGDDDDDDNEDVEIEDDLYET